MSVTSTSPGAASVWTRDVRFTGLPTTPYFARVSDPIVPTTTSPEFTATVISSGGSPRSASSAFTPSIRACIATAHATARAA